MFDFVETGSSYVTMNLVRISQRCESNEQNNWIVSQPWSLDASWETEEITKEKIRLNFTVNFAFPSTSNVEIN